MPLVPPHQALPGDDPAQRLSLAVELTDIGTWSVDLATGEGTHHARMARLLGIAPDDSRPAAELWRAFTHLDDHARVRAAFERATNACDETPRRYTTTHRIVRENGTERFLVVAAHVIVGTDGTPVRVTGIARDITVAAVDADEIVRGVEPLVRPQMAERALDHVHEAPATPAVARADRERVEQIVVNLLSNATKFTEPGGRITTSVAVEEAMIRIRVADTGIGIAEDKLMDIFEPFVQADATLTRTHSGAGLGLAIARKLATAMGGDLTVASTVGAGTAFTLSLPRDGAGA